VETEKPKRIRIKKNKNEMEPSTSIKHMSAGNRIFVPTYQRAYSWDTEFEKSKTPKQVNVFLSDLEDYNKSSTKSFEKINKHLIESNPIAFIKLFTHSLAISFEYLTTFSGKNEREQIEIHSLITPGGTGISIPFVIKAYKFGLPTNTINQLCNKFTKTPIS
jgi:hypothetical protein